MYAQAQAPSPVMGRRLLLVEDDPALRQMLTWDLAELGYRVHAVSTCQEARTVSPANGFDLAMLDVGLPDGDGLALARELAGMLPGLRVVICSGGHGESVPDSIPAAVLACLTKPVALERLHRLFQGSGLPVKD
ncbi:MAG: response regulator [Pseudomonadota bacterium]|nr:response regulator [Pseudomonadota bacterium]